jgi:hypothetical protein
MDNTPNLNEVEDTPEEEERSIEEETPKPEPSYNFEDKRSKPKNREYWNNYMRKWQQEKTKNNTEHMFKLTEMVGELKDDIEKSTITILKKISNQAKQYEVPKEQSPKTQERTEHEPPPKLKLNFNGQTILWEIEDLRLIFQEFLDTKTPQFINSLTASEQLKFGRLTNSEKIITIIQNI